MQPKGAVELNLVHQYADVNWRINYAAAIEKIKTSLTIDDQRDTVDTEAPPPTTASSKPSFPQSPRGMSCMNVYLYRDTSMNATIVDLRYRMKDVLRAIDRGETVTVLYRGKEKAILMPVGSALDSGAAKTADQPLFGLWKDREDLSAPASYVRNLRRPRQTPAEPAVKKQPHARKSK